MPKTETAARGRHLSRETGLDIVVEGVETEEQLVMIRDNNCADLIQGYIFGAPMPVNAFMELAKRMSQLLQTAAASAADARLRKSRPR
jgi:EAL domain-containing protein (putative c-di-GMP-specific phosphodiesterase class I)